MRSVQTPAETKQKVHLSLAGSQQQVSKVLRTSDDAYRKHLSFWLELTLGVSPIVVTRRAVVLSHQIKKIVPRSPQV